MTFYAAFNLTFDPSFGDISFFLFAFFKFILLNDDDDDGKKSHLGLILLQVDVFEIQPPEVD